jgi:hypothetical protein
LKEQQNWNWKSKQNPLFVLMCWMSGSLLLTDKDDIDNLNISTNSIHATTEHTKEEEEEQVNNWSALPLRDNDVCY